MLRILTAALTAVALLAAPSPAPSGSEPPVPLTRAEQWRAVADDALARFEQTTVGPAWRPFIYSHALLAVGRLHGWDDPRVPGLIGELLDARNPDGGWGTGAARKSLDGTTAPADTTYTVTLAGHVGPALLEAWKGHAYTDPEPLQTITKILVSQTVRMTDATGVCVAYSRYAGDATPCVHNVNAGVADYLTQASAAGFGRSGLQKLVVDITRREVTSYNTAWAGWPYADGRTVEQDADHGAYSGRSLYFLTYPVGREAVYAGLNPAALDDAGRRAHLQLVSVPGGPGSQGLVDPTTTLWCEMGDRWLPEATAYVASVAGDPMRLAQAAAWAAANANAC